MSVGGLEPYLKGLLYLTYWIFYLLSLDDYLTLLSMLDDYSIFLNILNDYLMFSMTLDDYQGPGTWDLGDLGPRGPGTSAISGTRDLGDIGDQGPRGPRGPRESGTPHRIPSRSPGNLVFPYKSTLGPKKLNSTCSIYIENFWRNLCSSFLKHFCNLLQYFV